MAIEAIKSAGMSYNTNASVKGAGMESHMKTENVSNEMASNNPSKKQVTNFNTTKTKVAGENATVTLEQQEQQNNQIRKAINEMNKKAVSSEAIFGIHEPTNRVTIKIVDKESREVIKEFPPEETLDMIAKVWELAGIMVDEKR